MAVRGACQGIAFFMALASAAILLACGSGAPGNSDAETDPREVVFRDSNLEGAVREAVGKPEGAIMSTDLESLLSLEATDRNIVSLEGLQYCTQMVSLELQRNAIVDISPLASMKTLTRLWVFGNEVEDISPLRDCQEITCPFSLSR